MTLRKRIGGVAALAVAVAVVGVAIAVYIAVRSELRGQVDTGLADRARPFLTTGLGLRGGPGGGRPHRGGPFVSNSRGPGGPPPGPERRFRHHGRGFDAGDRFRGVPHGRPNPFDPSGGLGAAAASSRTPFGGASGHVQFISSSGAVSEPADERAWYFRPSAAAISVATSGQGRLYEDMTVRGTHLRVLTVGRGQGGAIQVARPLTEVDHVLSNLVLVLGLVGAAGIVLAALLGGVVARTALAPVARFTRRTESITVNPDLSQRLEVHGKDELARLARSFNTTLEALAHSMESQRHLIADAGHELRTPIASLRANIQVLEEADRLPRHELESLRADIVEELDELTALVADIVELARGTKVTQSVDDVRVDELVQAQVDRSRRRASDLSFDVALEPTVVSGDAERINRAISNLLDNARKWSPPGGRVEVTLRHGLLAVRDHGPGFERKDLLHVFDRFYRADSARRLPGSGLGLAIVRQAAESHGGAAKAENAPDGGALVTVSFGPSAGAGEPMAPPAVPAAEYS